MGKSTSVIRAATRCTGAFGGLKDQPKKKARDLTEQNNTALMDILWLKTHDQAQSRRVLLAGGYPAGSQTMARAPWQRNRPDGGPVAT